MIPPSAIRELSRISPGKVSLDVPLSHISQWKIGGVADVVVAPSSVEEIVSLRSWLHSTGTPSIVVGATSNLLFSDDGVRAVVVKIGGSFSGLRISGSRIHAAPGTWVPGLARHAMLEGLSGVEHICGIPGTLGGLVYMNGGSMRRGIGECITAVQSVDSVGRLVTRNSDECQFGYRSSIFQQLDEVICRVTISLEPKSASLIRRSMLEILRDRRLKFPRKLPNCGSVFVSNPSMYAEFGPPGRVIEECGYKGLRFGGARVSPQHANFIVNESNATASDVMSLIDFVRAGVARRTGYLMKVEARYVESTGIIREI
jgi:UDP-N-acetylenolpyruvoylglucosamine reductase